MPPYELDWLQKVSVSHDCLSSLCLEARDILQKLHLLVSLLEFNFCQTLRKVFLVQRSKVNRLLSHGLYRRIPGSSCQQRISPETIFLVFLIDFLEVHVVHPLISIPINCKRVRDNIFEKLQLGSLFDRVYRTSNLHLRSLAFSVIILVRGYALAIADCVGDVTWETFTVNKGRVKGGSRGLKFGDDLA